jgi:hypothetical protein
MQKSVGRFCFEKIYLYLALQIDVKSRFFDPICTVITIINY